MTNKEAIESLKFQIKQDETLITNEENFEVWNHKIKTRNEVYKTAIEALEKQIPKKPKRRISRVTAYCICPCCTVAYGLSRGWKYCPECGQKLDWGEEE